MIAALRALAYFTIVPIPRRWVAAGPPDAAALAFLPLVGTFVGAAAGLFAWLVASRMPGWGAAAAWIALLVLTGGVHVDGFLDCCDGLPVSASPERRLTILRDPHHGSFALMGMTVLAVVWLEALGAIAPARLPLALAFAGTTGRLASVTNAWFFAYARNDGFQAAFARRLPVLPVACAVAVAAALGWMLGPATIALLGAAAVVGIVLAGAANRRLGGLTGDVYGAIAVTAEVLVLVGVPFLGVPIR